MITDKQLQESVRDELDFEPSVDAAHIGIVAEHGVVTLTGHVSTYVQKLAAEHAAKRVKGVRAIAQEIEVRLPTQEKRSDDQIAERIVQLQDWDSLIPEKRVQVKVEKGWVTLSGEVAWQYQKRAAESDAGKITGVRGVTNLMIVKPPVATVDVRSKIEAAFRRNAQIESSGITITTEGSKVVLGGRVKAWHERELAERAAWSAPGVTRVEDNITLA